MATWLDQFVPVYAGDDQLRRSRRLVGGVEADRRGIRPVAGDDGLSVLVVSLDLSPVPHPDGDSGRPAGHQDHQCSRHHGLVGGDHAHRRFLELRLADRHAPGHGHRRSHHVSRRRSRSARVDTGGRARPDQCDLHGRHTGRSGSGRVARSVDHQPDRLARIVSGGGCRGFHLAAGMADLVRPAGEGTLAWNRGEGQDPA